MPDTTSSMRARGRSRKLSMRSPSMKPCAGSVLRSFENDLQVDKIKEKIQSHVRGYSGFRSGDERTEPEARRRTNHADFDCGKRRANKMRETT